MKIKWIIGIFISLLILRFYFPFEVYGAEKIKYALSDGDGGEFIMNVGMSKSHFSTVQETYDWVVSHMKYKIDPNPPDVWTSSLKQYGEILLNGVGEGDCDDYAILLCSLLRFHTFGGIPEDRVWVTVSQIIGGTHAWVQYIDEKGNYWILDPVNEKIEVEKAAYILKFNDKMVLPLNQKNYAKFNWNNFEGKIINEIIPSLIAPIIIILFAFVVLNVLVNVDFIYCFYFSFFSCLTYLIIIFL